MHRQKHRNTFFLILCAVVFIVFSQTPYFYYFNNYLDKIPLLAAVIAGVFFASTFTAIAGGMIIIHLAVSMNPFLIVALAGLGAVAFDTFIFLFFRHHVSHEVNLIYQEINHHSHLKKLVHTKYFGWTLPVLGALIIASPFPDELGVSLLGLSQTSLFRFLLISTASHLFGIGSVVMVSLGVNV